jgi:NAD(P)-dependent dehydrogenase (short-subunit alcohol dehydrogenase family)
MKGRVAIITGASGNLGAAIAKLMASHGVKLALFDRDESKTTHAVEGLDPASYRVFTVDVTDEGSVKAAIESAKSALGEIDALVSTVGGFKGGAPTTESPWADWDSMLKMNLHTAVACARAVLPTFIAQKRGSIVHVASLAALGASPGSPAYGASKAALLHFTQTVAEETKNDGVRVNAVLPGTMDTPQNRSWMSPEDAAKAIDLAAVADVVFFLSSSAARAVTGSAIKVTGRQ